MSPICNLAIIERLEFLRRRYRTVHIPPEVAEGLQALSHRRAKDAIQRALDEQWLLVAIPLESIDISIPLDKGEKAAISLAVEMKAEA
jgi:predicted nucleic acid-binding protein